MRSISTALGKSRVFTWHKTMSVEPIPTMSKAPRLAEDRTQEYPAASRTAIDFRSLRAPFAFAFILGRLGNETDDRPGDRSVAGVVHNDIDPLRSLDGELVFGEFILIGNGERDIASFTQFCGQAQI